MSNDTKGFLPPAGLYTDPNPHTAAPLGALRTADNVVLRRSGMLEARPSFDRATFSSPPASHVPVRGYEYDGDMLIISENGYGSGTFRADWASNETQCGLPTDGNDFGFNWQRAAIARKHLYLATNGRVARIRAAATTPGVALTSPPLELSVASASGTLLADGQKIAIRYVIVRKLAASGTAEEFLSTTTPSQRVTYERSTSAGTCTVTCQRIDYTASAGDILQIYRSKISTGTPSDELFLAHDHEITSTDISNTSYAVDLTLTDDELGALLYTNPSQEGFDTGANVAPPSCRDLALFHGSLFFAYITQPHRLTLSFVTSSSTGAVKTASATGIGVRVYTGDTTSGSPTVTNLSSTVGLKIGMIITNANFASGTYVTNIVGSTLTMSANASATVVGTSITFTDAVWIKRGGTTERFTSAGTNNALSTVNTAAGSTLCWSRAFHDRRNSNGTPNQPSVGQVSVMLESRLLGGGSFEVFATHGSEYTPELPEPTEANGESSVQEVQPNGLWWSKADQPEHVPTVNFALVGDRSRILRLVATRDVLWIFKADGLFKLTGFGADAGWQIDPVDATAVLLHPEAACVLVGECYAWCSRGILHVTEGGIDNVSGSAIGVDLKDHEDVIAASTGVSNLDTAEVLLWLAGNEKEGEVLVHLPSLTDLDAGSSTIYCYHVGNRAWTKWALSASHAVTVVGQLRLLSSTDYSYRKEQRPVFESYQGQFDRTFACTIASIVGTTITINGGSGWTPAVGDAITQSSDPAVFSVVTAITSATVFTVDSATGLSTTGATGLQAFTCTIEYQAQGYGVPTTPKSWRDVSIAWGSLARTYDYAVSAVSDISDTSSDCGDPELTRTTSVRPRVHRFRIPREHARSHQIFPKVAITQAMSRWSLQGLSMGVDAVATTGTRNTGA